MATLVCKGCIVIFSLFLAACGGTESRNFATYRKYPDTCSAEQHFAALSQDEKISYTFGALHVKPRPDCISDLLSRQNFSFLLFLQQQIEEIGGFYDRYAFIEAVMKKRRRGELSDSQLQKFALESFCTEVDDQDRCEDLLIAR